MSQTTPEKPKGASLVKIKEFFGGFAGLKDFQDQWNELSATDKEQIKAGIGDGSLTY